MERWILDVAKHVYLLAFQQCKSWTDSSTLVTHIIAIAGEAGQPRTRIIEINGSNMFHTGSKKDGQLTEEK